MLKTNKLALSLSISGLLAGCANIDDSYQASKLDFKQYEEITQQYNIKENWWTLYNDVQLNRVIEQALTNNTDLARAAIAVNSALYLHSAHQLPPPQVKILKPVEIQPLIMVVR